MSRRMKWSDPQRLPLLAIATVPILTVVLRAEGFNYAQSSTLAFFFLLLLILFVAYERRRRASEAADLARLEALAPEPVFTPFSLWIEARVGLMLKDVGFDELEEVNISEADQARLSHLSVSRSLSFIGLHKPEHGGFPIPVIYSADEFNERRPYFTTTIEWFESVDLVSVKKRFFDRHPKAFIQARGDFIEVGLALDSDDWKDLVLRDTSSLLDTRMDGYYGLQLLIFCRIPLQELRPYFPEIRGVRLPSLDDEARSSMMHAFGWKREDSGFQSHHYAALRIRPL